LATSEHAQQQKITMDELGDPFDRQKGIDGWNQELLEKQV
jgi:hypothetical protein